jgi:hypothetical protein
MPSFENLKKQVKLVLRWHRERYYPVAAQIRTMLPRFRHLSDPEILSAPFKLSDAQELVARSQGFENWQGAQDRTYSHDKQDMPTRRQGRHLRYRRRAVRDFLATAPYWPSLRSVRVRPSA